MTYVVCVSTLMWLRSLDFWLPPRLRSEAMSFAVYGDELLLPGNSN